MGEIRLDRCCRLCLKEGFSLTNIFSHRSATGDPLYRIVNFIYETKIFENDGLPSQICTPCMWRMIEFDACKRNVRSAETEIMRILNQTKPEEGSEVEIDHSPLNLDVPVKEEFDIVEWEMPLDTAMKRQVPKADYFVEDDGDHKHEFELTEAEPVEVPASKFEERGNERVFCQTLREELVKIEADEFEEECVERISSEQPIKSSGSSDLQNSLSLENLENTVHNLVEGKGSSFDTTPEISARIRDTNKGVIEKYLSGYVEPAQIPLSTEQPKSMVNNEESELIHLQAALSERKSGFVCDICEKRFQRKNHLGGHVRVHYEERPFSCNVCNESFKQDSARKRHELRHLRDKISEKGSMKKLYCCNICGKSFSYQKGLCAHYNQHTNKFACGSCGKSFGCNADLKIHWRIHTKEKPFKCELCDKSFIRKDILKRHLTSHSDERPFLCSICDKKFKRKSVKDNHELIHLRNIYNPQL